MPAAARLSDMHSCPKVEPKHAPHVGGPVSSGCSTVLIGGLPAARVDDALTCKGPADVIVQGEPTVIIGNRPAARVGDATGHGGAVVAGCPTVLIGSVSEPAALEVQPATPAALKGCALKLASATESGAAGVPQ